MERLLRPYLGLLLLSFFSVGCGGDEDILPDGANEESDTPKETTASVRGTSCDDIVIKGYYEVGLELTDSNYIEVSVNVVEAGDYFFETEENNGFRFTASGTFEETGDQVLIYEGKGRPVEAGEFDYQLKFGNASCRQVVGVYEKDFPTAAETVIINSGEPFMGESYNTYAHDANGKLLWKKSGLASIPVVDGDMAYMVINNQLEAVNVVSGETVWRTESDYYLVHEAIVGDNQNLYVEGDGFLVAFSKNTGQEVWRDSLNLPSRVPNNPTIVDGYIYIAYVGVLYKYDNAGNRIWGFPMEKSIRSNVAVVDDIVYIGNDDGSLYAIDANDTSTLWSYNVDMSGKEAPTIEDGKLYIQGKAELFCLDAKTGAKIWSYAKEYYGTNWTTPTVANGMVYATGFGNGVIALDKETGEFLWKNTASAPSTSTPPTVLGSLLVSQGANGMAAINALNGSTLWNYGELDPWKPEQSVSFNRSSVIYDMKTGEISYPGNSGMKQ